MTNPLRDALGDVPYIPTQETIVGGDYYLYVKNTSGVDRRIRITPSAGPFQDFGSYPVEEQVAALNNPTLSFSPTELTVCLGVEFIDPITCAGATSSSNCFALIGLHDVYVNNVRVIQNANPAQILSYFDDNLEEGGLRIEFCPQCSLARNEVVIFTHFSGEWDWYINGQLYKTGDVTTWQIEPNDTYGLYFSGDDPELAPDLRNTYTIMTTDTLNAIGRASNLLVPKNNASSYTFHPLMEQNEVDTLSFHLNGAIGWCFDPVATAAPGTCESGSSFAVLYFPLLFTGEVPTLGEMTFNRPDIAPITLTYDQSITPQQMVALVNGANIPDVYAILQSFEEGVVLAQIYNTHPTLNVTLVMQGVIPDQGYSTGNPSESFELDTFSVCLMPEFKDTLEGLKMQFVNQGSNDARIRLVTRSGFSITYGGDNPTQGYNDANELTFCVSPLSDVVECEPTTVIMTPIVIPGSNV